MTPWPGQQIRFCALPASQWLVCDLRQCGNAFQVPQVFAIINVACAHADRATVWNLSAPVMSAQKPFSSGFLAAQVLMQIASCDFIRIYMQQNALVTERHHARNLLGAPLNLKVKVTSPQTSRSTLRALRIHKARSEALVKTCSAR